MGRSNCCIKVGGQNCVTKFLFVQNEEFSDQLIEATLSTLDAAVREHHTTLLGFSGVQKHYETEEILVQVSNSET